MGHNLIIYQLFPTKQILCDYMLMFFAAMPIISIHSLANTHNVFNLGAKKCTRNISMHTFGLYLFHMPVLYFVSAVTP
jgi:surface polysaccharide O-acyltransferase-like enzyme